MTARIEIKKRLTAAAWLLLVAAIAGGCATGERERFFKLQAFAVEPTPGDGSSRIAAWPMPASVAVTQADGAETRDDVPWTAPGR